MADNLLAQLEQTEFWGSNDKYRLEEMEPEHIDNVVNYLIRIADSLKFQSDFEMAVCQLPNGEQARSDFEDAVNVQFATDDLTWLEETPLMIRLRELQAQRSIGESFL